MGFKMHKYLNIKIGNQNGIVIYQYEFENVKDHLSLLLEDTFKEHKADYLSVSMGDVNLDSVEL